MPIGVDKAPGNLPDKAKRQWVAVFNNAFEGSCKDEKGDARDQCAAQQAWGAVKQHYSKGSDNEWHPKSDVEVVELSLYITKASLDKATGEMRWLATASDTDPDVFDERMTLELFNDFCRRINENEPAPEVIQTDYWKGGKPYVSVSHYPDMDGKWSAGTTTEVYVNGNQLKAKGIFYDTEVGRACFKSVCQSLYGENKDTQQKVRISIGFLDYKHSHGPGFVFERKALTDKCPMCKNNIKDKSYLAGYLVHLALTRFPANKRTDIEAEVNKSMTTQVEDAASIIGEDLAKKMDEDARAEVFRSEVFVSKSDEELVEESSTEDAKKAQESKSDALVEDSKPKKMPTSVEDELDKIEDAQPGEADPLDDGTLSEEDKAKCKKKKPEMKSELTRADVEEIVTKAITDAFALALKPVEKTALDESIETLKSVYNVTVQRSDISGEDKLRIIHEQYVKVGDMVVKSVSDLEKPKVEDIPVVEKSTVDYDQMVKMMSDVVRPLQDQLQLLSQRIAAPQVESASRQQIPQRRSIQATAMPQVNRTEQASTTPKLHELIQRSVFGPKDGLL